jgi:uncharacterized short protein YbdD (DUF466 family)
MLRQRTVWPEAVRIVQRVWSRIREWCGDAAYERYLRANKGLEEKAKLGAKEFYLEQTQRRYSQPNRCC